MKAKEPSHGILTLDFRRSHCYRILGRVCSSLFVSGGACCVACCVACCAACCAVC